MKKQFVLFFLICGVFCSTLLAGGPDDPSKAPGNKLLSHKKCLAVSAKPVVKGIPVLHVTIKLYKAGKQILEIAASAQSRVYFVLESNTDYAIRFSKEGFVDRLVTFNTTLPSNLKLNPLFSFDFEIEMLLQNDHMDPYYLDFPTAIVAFNKGHEKFEHSKKYTENMKHQTGELQGNGEFANFEDVTEGNSKKKH